VQPQIHLPTPPVRHGKIVPLGRGGNAGGSGGTIVVPGPPIPPQPACAGDIGEAIAGAVIDPSRLGISMNLLNDGFRLTSITLRSEADCGADGQATSAVPVLETNWSATPGGQLLFLTQRPQTQSQGNLLDNGLATFWWEGFQYTAQIQFPVPIYGKGVAEGPGPDDAQPILLQAISELAPGLDLSCFSQRTSGTWSNLSALGIGDPRPALPAGFSESSFELDYRTTPPPTCDVGTSAADSGVYFSAGFTSADGGTISIGAWSLTEGTVPYPGALDDYSLSWSSDAFQFSLYGDDNGAALGSSVLLAIAQKLDPAFSPACLLQIVTLSSADLPALGFHAPQPPPDYVLSSEALSGDAVSSSCARHFEFRGTYSLSWSYVNNDGAEISASAYRVVSDHPGPRTTPLVSDTCISWSDDKGTTYFVIGSSVTGASVPGKDVLIAVAKSMDPGLVI
jgi:hypothetical protein